MDVMLDTCSWLKVQRIESEKIIDLRPLLYAMRLWATHELVAELKYYMADYLDISRFSIKHVQLERFSSLTDKELDPADLSIIAFGREHAGSIIISDDGCELAILQFFNVRCFQLSEFLVTLATMDVMKKHDAYKSIRVLRNARNIKERKMKALHARLNQVR